MVFKNSNKSRRNTRKHSSKSSNGSKSRKISRKRSRKNMLRVIAKGGFSPASRRVMSHVNNPSGRPAPYPAALRVVTPSPCGNLNTYETTGGGKHKKSKKRSGKRTCKCCGYKNCKCKRCHNKACKYRCKKCGEKKCVCKSHKSKKSKKVSRRRKQRGGGSDWITSQYSGGPINVASGAKSNPNAVNPPNLGSAGSGAPMSFSPGSSTYGAPL